MKRILAGLLVAAACGSTARAEPAYLDDRSDAAQLVRSLYNAVNRHEYARAYDYFVTPPVKSYDAYVKGYEDTEFVDVLTGEVKADGAAGSTYYTVPTAIRAKGKGGTSYFAGCYTIKAVNGAIQDPPSRPLQIQSAKLKPAKEEDYSATSLPTCGDGGDSTAEQGAPDGQAAPAVRAAQAPQPGAPGKPGDVVKPARSPRSMPAILDAGLWVATYEHLALVVSSLLLACLIGIPLGIIAFQYRTLGQILVATTGLVQTIPSLALLCFLIPVLGIGALPTIFALFIYGLLPIAQSTASGLLSLDKRLIETAKILGLSRMQRLRLIELPLSALSILGGIKTAAVINVATATIAALIGAGGYGAYITQGLAMNDLPTILKGAVPTALMAVGFHGLFELLTELAVPEGLRS